MAVALLRRAASFATSFSFSVESADRLRGEPIHRVGEYAADYSEVSPKEIAAPIPEMDALLARSKVVSVKRGL